MTLAMEPAAVKAGESLSVQTYRLIGQRRAGMDYAPATGGGLGGEIEFTASRTGTFTRNFVQENGQLLAEIR